MTPEQWARLNSLVERALNVAPELRSAFLHTECPDDPEILALALDAVRRGSQTSSFMSAPDLDAIIGPGDEADLAGRTIGNFKIHGRIGAGAMGVVYRATQATLNRDVALKVLLPALLATPERRARFKREAMAVAKLRHPNIVTIFDVGEDHGLQFLAMELVEGTDLARELARLNGRSPSAGILPLPDSPDYIQVVVGLAIQAASALAHAHAIGVVHRDIKPANLLLDSRGQIRIVDFGLAQDSSQPRISQDGQRAGTPSYMSPEQFTTSMSDVDERTDVYSLGVVLFELLTLHTFRASSPEWSRAALEAPPPLASRLNPRVGRDLALVCSVAMRPERSARYPDAAAFEQDLRRVLRGETVRAKPEALRPRVRRWMAAHRGYVVTSSLSLLAAIVFYKATSWNQYRRLAERVAAVAESPAGVASASDSLDELERRVAALESTHSRIAALREMGDALPLDLESKLAARTHALVQEADTVLQQLVACLPHIVSKSLGSEGHSGDIARCLTSIKKCGALLPGDDTRDDDAVQMALYPRISIAVAADSAEHCRVGLVPLLRGCGLPVDGAHRRDIGQAPIVDMPIEPGTYRIEVSDEWDKCAEVIATVDPGLRYDFGTLCLRPRPAPPAVQTSRSAGSPSNDDMVYIKPGSILVDSKQLQETGSDVDEKPRPVKLEGFWIDRHEVSNAEYKRFTDATGHRVPAYWPPAYATAWTEWSAQGTLMLPVVGVDCLDAEAYARWAGKRLPTHLEWVRAAGGPNQCRFPWGDDERNERESGNTRSEARAAAPLEPGARYLALARTVCGSQGDVSPEGVCDTLGNVREWTALFAFQVQSNGLYQCSHEQRIVAGGSFEFPQAPLCEMSVVQVGMYGPDIGFRCARSSQQ